MLGPPRTSQERRRSAWRSRRSAGPYSSTTNAQTRLSGMSACRSADSRS